MKDKLPAISGIGSDALLPISAVLIVGGFGFLKYRSYVKKNRENYSAPLKSLTESQRN